MIIAKTPFRVTLAGGGTDLPSFYEDHEGLVISMAINKHIYVTIKENIFDDFIRLRYLETEYVSSVNNLKHDRAREALKQSGIFTGVEVTSTADLPGQSGMGSSGSFLVAILSAITRFQNKTIDPYEIAEKACDIEIKNLCEPVGKQDQYIAALGGIKMLQIDHNGSVEVTDLTDTIGKNNISELVQHMNIYKLDTYRNASKVLEAQNNKETKTHNTLNTIKDMALQSLDSINNGQLKNFGRILDDYWAIKKTLSNRVSTSQIDELYKTVKNNYGVLGGKVIGAGGGGFILLFCEPSKKLDEFMNSKNMPKLKYNPSNEGVKVINL